MGGLVLGTAWYSTGNTTILCLLPLLLVYFNCSLFLLLIIFLFHHRRFTLLVLFSVGWCWVMRGKREENDVVMSLKIPPISEEGKGKNGSIYVVLCGSLIPKLHV